MKDDTEHPIDPDYIQHLSEEFDLLCQIRHDKGGEEYGPLNFLKVPIVQYAAEELADLCNYARFMYIRLRLLEETLRASGIDMSAGSTEEIRAANEISPGPTTFVPGAEIPRFLPDSEQGG